MNWWMQKDKPDTFGAPWHLVILGRTACKRPVGGAWTVHTAVSEPDPRTRCRLCVRAITRNPLTDLTKGVSS